MAQASLIVFNRLANMVIKAGEVYTSDSILALYPTAKVVILNSEKARININATDAIYFHRDDIEYLNGGKTWSFVDDCEVSVATVVELVP
jgi:hypothetical protein